MNAMKGRCWKICLAVPFAVLLVALGGCSSGDQGYEGARKTPAPQEKAKPLSGGLKRQSPANFKGNSKSPGEGGVRVKSIHLEPANPVTGDTVRAVVNLHNPLGLETSVQYRWRINGKVMEGEGKILSTPVHYGDVVSVEVAVSVPGQELEPVAATVMVGNAPPVVELSKESLRDGEYLASFTLKDPEGDPLQFRLLQGPEGMSVDGGQPILRWRPEKGTVGVFQVAVEAEDEAGNRTQYTFDMTVSPPQEAGDRKAAGKTP